MTSDFTVADATKYNAVISGNTIKINDLELFLEDWRTMKKKAKKWDESQKPFDIVEEIEKIRNDPSPRGVWISVETLYKMVDLKEKADAMLRFRKASEDLGEYAADLDDKLEAIGTWLEETKERLMYEHGVPELMDDGLKILGRKK